MTKLNGPGSIKSGLNALQYIASYDDLIAALGAASEAGVGHYDAYGSREGRQLTFDGLGYVAANADLMAAIGADAEAGARHFIVFGHLEARTTSFASYEYVASYADLTAALGDAEDAGARHFIQFGHAEGRQITFNAKGYLDAYADLKAAFGGDGEAAAHHYLQFGRAEGRVVPAVEAVPGVPGLEPAPDPTAVAVGGDNPPVPAPTVPDPVPDPVPVPVTPDPPPDPNAPRLVTGSDGDDLLTGGPGPDTIQGLAGRDTLIGGAGNDLLDGGPGFDLADYASASEGITAALAAGRVTGGVSVGTDTLRGIEAVTGTPFNDVFDATGFAASATATRPNASGTSDLSTEFEGLGGNDRVVGNGFTRLSFAHADAGVSANIATGQASGFAAGDLARIGNDTFSGVVSLRGSAFDDLLTGSNNAAGTTEVFEGLAGNDTLAGAGGLDIARYDNSSVGRLGITVDMAAGIVTGRDAAAAAAVGTDTLRSIEWVRGTRGDDFYMATGFGATSANAGSNGGFNVFDGGPGDDTVTGNGATQLQYGSALASITFEGRTGTVHGTANGDVAGVGTDTFTGVSGAAGSLYDDLFKIVDAISGGASVQSHDGGAGFDTLDLSGVFLGPVTFNLQTGALTTSSLSVSGTETSFEAVVGTDRSDTLVGSSVANLLSGGNGNDVLTGGLGDDTLDGGAGTDIATYSSASERYEITTKADGSMMISGPDGTDTLAGVELIRFTATYQLVAGTTDLRGINVSGPVYGTTENDDVVIDQNSGHIFDFGAGRDTLRVTAPSGTVYASNIENIIGSSSLDLITVLSSSAVVTLTAGRGDDQIFLQNTGSDTLRVVSAVDSRARGTSIVPSGDRITNFDADKDRFLFDSSEGGFAGLKHITYVGPAPFSGEGEASAHLDRYLSFTVLQVDVDGDGSMTGADMEFQLNTMSASDPFATYAATLSQANFLLI